ncbi:hypothetical protein LINGRAHAP2_LOCUS20279, partial [Linum grandiflorum]
VIKIVRLLFRGWETLESYYFWVSSTHLVPTWFIVK